jgi:hypothetical protein
MKRTLVIDVTGHFCNTWPNLQVIINNKLCFDDSIVDNKQIAISFDSLQHNTMQLSLTNKSLGENNVWDTVVDDLNEITHDKFIKFNNVLLEDVNITELIYRSPYTVIATNDTSTTHHGLLNFNGDITFCFNEPILNFLINAKYKREIDTTQSYFSNSTYLFHYDMETQLIGEIRELLSNADD